MWHIKKNIIKQNKTKSIQKRGNGEDIEPRECKVTKIRKREF